MEDLAASGSTRSQRVNMRIAPESLDLLRRAARTQQQDLSSFVLGAALDRARAVMTEVQILELSATEAARLDALLEEEPRVLPRLAEAIRAARAQRARDDVTAST
jgi:uncharacterized protein (DUF1778 family)